MWVKSGETVSEISSELSPISISGRVELRNLHSLSLWPEEATFDFSHKTHFGIQHVIMILEDFV